MKFQALPLIVVVMFGVVDLPPDSCVVDHYGKTKQNKKQTNNY